MELREMVMMFRREARIFVSVLVFFCFVGLVFPFFQSDRQIAKLMLNVTRTGSQQTQDYKYDYFYRLQADERFADTIVRWIGFSGIVNEIRDGAGIGQDRKIKAERLSSQMIEVSFKVNNQDEAENISKSISEVLNAQIKDLNENQKEESWFLISASPVVVLDGKIPFEVFFPAMLSLGLFFGVLGVMLKNYWRE